MRGPKLSWPRHERWVRGHECSVPGCRGTPVVFAHVRDAANAGTSIKPHSAFGRPLCNEHHLEEHAGVETFDRKYGIDRYRQAAWFYRRSPDAAMRESFLELAEHVKRPLLEAA